jgi:hypothetical protein
MYSFLLLLLIPGIFILSNEILKETKFIKENQMINLEDEKITKYNQVKKYYNIGVFMFSFYLTLNKYPYFSICNKYYNKYYNAFPRFIKHLVIINGLVIGLIMPLIPYLNIKFSERETFIARRDINSFDSEIQNAVPDKYYVLSIFFSFLGLISGNLFIYIASKILNFEKEELDIWLKIKTVCKDYIYYEIKSEVLLGAVWKKIKMRMFSYYYICGNHILSHNKKNQKNNKFKDYLVHVSRKYDEQKSLRTSLNDIDLILPRMTYDSNSLNISKDINNNSKNQKEFEMAENFENEPLINNEDDDEIIINNNNKRKKIIGNKVIFNKSINSSINRDLNLKLCKLDNFILDNKNYYNKSKIKRQFERFEKVRNKYIYIHKRNEINEIEIDEHSFDEKDKCFYISSQINYSYLQNQSFMLLNEGNRKNETTGVIHKFVLISIILMAIFICLIIISLILVKTILNKFDEFIIKAWIFPIIILITVINFILYFLKILIGSSVLFCFYHLRKKSCFIRCLFWLFVDKSMIQAYKVKKLITKYKKEFDYLQQ